MSGADRARERSLRILLPIVIVDLIGFGIIIPLLPFYGEHFGASPAQVGLLMAVFSCTQFVTAPLWGRLSDRIGRRPVLLLTLAGLAVSYVWLAFADGLIMLFAARAVGGVMAGNIGVAFAYAADVTDATSRARGMGMIGAAYGVGFVFGPAIGGILAGADPLAADYATPALTAAGLTTLALVLAAWRLPESLSAEARARQRGLSGAERRQAFRRSLAQPGVALLIALLFLTGFVFAGMETTFAMWSRRAFGWGPEQNGYLFAFVGLLTAALQGGAIGHLAKRYGEERLVVWGAAALALGMLMIPVSASVPMLLAAMVVVAIGFSLVSPSLNSLVSLRVGTEALGGAMGVTRSASTLSRILGSMWAGALFFWVGRDWPYYGGALVMLVVVVLMLHQRRRMAAAAGEAAER